MKLATTLLALGTTLAAGCHETAAQPAPRPAATSLRARVLLHAANHAITQAVARTPSRPLTDCDGRPACGNVGQSGRLAPQAVSAAPDAAAAGAVMRPRNNNRERPMCGNVVGKGSRRPCEGESP